MRTEHEAGLRTPPPRPSRVNCFEVLIGTMNAIGTVWIIALMLLINSDIIGRALFNSPITGVPELVVFSIVGIVFLQLAHTLRSGSMTRSDVLLEALKRAPRIRHALLFLFHLTGAVLFGIVVYKFWPSLASAWGSPARYFMGTPGVFSFPYWPVYAVMLIGIVAVFFQFALMAFQDLDAALGGRRSK